MGFRHTLSSPGATSHMTHAECGWSKLSWALSVKYSLDFKDSIKKGYKVSQCFYADYMK